MSHKWLISKPFTVKKSKFRSYIIPISQPSEIPDLLSQLVTLDKSLQKASHPTMYAYKHLNSQNQLIDEGFDDNGEAGAGRRLLMVLEQLKFGNLLVVVSRWYGGIPLGSKRFKVIGEMVFKNLETDENYQKILNQHNENRKNDNWYDLNKIISKT